MRASHRCALPAAFVLIASVLAGAASGGQPVPAQVGRFAGTWVGTQSWAIADPPPGARQDQPVTLTIEIVEGRATGTLRPFLGGEEGATLVDADIVGDELRARAVVGRTRTAPQAGRVQNWKDAVTVAFVFRNDGLAMIGSADVAMGDVPWLKFAYRLEKKRSRY